MGRGYKISFPPLNFWVILLLRLPSGFHSLECFCGRYSILDPNLFSFSLDFSIFLLSIQADSWLCAYWLRGGTWQDGEENAQLFQLLNFKGRILGIGLEMMRRVELPSQSQEIFLGWRKERRREREIRGLQKQRVPMSCFLRSTARRSGMIP